MRIGIYGGSFDPVHYGHLILAERCREEANLDQVWFVPSCIGPHKREGPLLTDRQRVELIELAIAGHASFVVSDLELKRGGVSFTVDTLNEIKKLQPDSELFLLMGADSAERFHTWREPGEICQLAIPMVVNRPGSKPVNLDGFAKYVDDSQLKKIKDQAVESPLIEISSSEIRRRIDAQLSIRYLLPRAVEKYIQTQKLYLNKEIAKDS